MGFSGTGINEVEIPLGRGVDEDVVGAFPNMRRVEVVAGPAELMDEVMQDCPACPAGGVEAGAAEAVERVDVEMVLEELVGMFGEESVAFIDEAVREFSKLSGLVIRDEKLGRGNAGELVFEQAEICKFRDRELAGGMVDTGEPDGFSMAENGGEVVWALVVEEFEVVDGAGGQNTGNLPGNEFSGDGLGRLLGDGNAFPCLEQAGDVALRGVVGDAAHGGATTFGEGDVHDRRGVFCVVEEHLVEVAETVEKDHVGRQGFPHGLVLGHHRGQCRLGHGRRLEGRFGRIKKGGIFRGIWKILDK